MLGFVVNSRCRQIARITITATDPGVRGLVQDEWLLPRTVRHDVSLLTSHTSSLGPLSFISVTGLAPSKVGGLYFSPLHYLFWVHAPPLIPLGIKVLLPPPWLNQLWLIYFWAAETS